jgi:iron complex transport system substrate-binding protein
VAFTDYSAEKEWYAHRFAGKASLPGLGRLEAILALEPDLLLISALDDRRKAARLRESGLNVFDLGPMEGFASLQQTIARLGVLLSLETRSRRYAAELERRVRSIAVPARPEQRRSAMYLSVYGQKIYGGALNTSFHDVLTFAGLDDVAAKTFSGWPLLSPEQVLMLDPEIVVTNERMAQLLCANPGLERLRACKPGHGLVTLPEWLLGDPGPNLVLAAELLNEAVYGKQGNVAPP